MNFKKITAISLLISMMGFGSASAEFHRYNYGSLIGDPVTGDSDTGIAYNGTVHDNATFTYGMTDEDSHSGKRSYYVDYRSSTGSISVVNSSGGMKNNKVMENNPVYAEMYVKGVPASRFTYGNIRPLFQFCDSSWSSLANAEWHYEKADRNGWIKCWAIGHTRKSFSNINLGLLIIRDDPYDMGMDRIYIDDIKLVSIPESIEIADIDASEGMLELDDVNVYGRDLNGKRTEIFTKDQIKYTVKSGNAYVDDYGTLVAQSAGMVTVAAKFFGKTTEFDVEFDQGREGVYASEPVFSEGKYTVSVTNQTYEPVKVRLQTVLLDGTKFIKLIKTDKEIEAGATDSIISEINVPFYVRNPQYKTYVLAEQNDIWQLAGAQ